MGKVIILEGPDGCGKTTLAKKLVSHGWEYCHEGPPPLGVDVIDYYLRKLYDSLTGPANVVHDRLHLGERVYGKIARGTDSLGSEGLKLFERLHQSKAITQIICLTDFETAKDNYLVKIKDKEDYLQSFEKWTKVYDAYKNYIGSNSNYTKDWRQFNYQIDNLYDVLELSKLYSSIVLPSGAVGSLKAKYLFIGDRPNHDYIDIPFFALSGSSGYLNKALELAHLKEEEIALYNANDCFGAAHDNYFDLRVALNDSLRHIFVMGNEAGEFLSNKKLGREMVKFHHIQHPSYLKRFRGNNPVVMAELIRSCIDGVVI